MGIIDDLKKQSSKEPTVEEQPKYMDSAMEGLISEEELEVLKALRSEEELEEELEALKALEPEAEVEQEVQPLCDLQSTSDIAEQVPTIASSAMCVHIEFCKWGGPITDRQVTNEVLIKKKATEGAGIFKKKPFPQSMELKRIESLSNTLRNRGITHCLPWIGNGWYLLPTANFTDFMETMNQAKKEWDEAVDAFLIKYPQLVKDDAAEMGDLYDSNMYPPVDVLRREFVMEIHQMEVQMSGKAKFYETLTEAQIQQSKDNITNQNDRFVGAITAYIWKKLREPLVALQDVLDESKHRGKDKPRYQQSRVDNILDAVVEAKALNVGSDTQLSAMAAKIQTAFIGISTDALKEDSYLRNEIRNTIKNLIDGIPS